MPRSSGARAPAPLSCRLSLGETRNRRAWPVLVGILGVALLVPFDGWLSERLWLFTPTSGQESRREVFLIEGFGAPPSLMLVALVIVLLDRRWMARVTDLAFATGCSALVTLACKFLIARPRPMLGEPGVFLGPFGTMAVPGGTEGVRAWEVWVPGSNELCSLPSGHASCAVALATFLGVTYPRLRWMYLVAAGICILRVLGGAHWVSDVVAGSLIGWGVSGWATRGRIGSRVYGRLAQTWLSRVPREGLARGLRWPSPVTERWPSG